MKETATTKSPPVRLVDLATELGVPIEALEIDERDVFKDAPGFRVVTGFTASRVLEIHRAREARQKATAARNNAQVRAAGERARASIGKGVEKLSLSFATIDVNPAPAAAVMMAKEPPPSYDGSVSTPRPSRMDWMLGKGESAGTFGPSREKIQENAQKSRGRVHTPKQKGGRK